MKNDLPSMKLAPAARPKVTAVPYTFAWFVLSAIAATVPARTEVGAPGMV